MKTALHLCDGSVLAKVTNGGLMLESLSDGQQKAWQFPAWMAKVFKRCLAMCQLILPSTWQFHVLLHKACCPVACVVPQTAEKWWKVALATRPVKLAGHASYALHSMTMPRSSGP